MMLAGVKPSVHNLCELAVSETISRKVKGKINWGVSDDILVFKIPSTGSSGCVTTVESLETVLREVANLKC